MLIQESANPRVLGWWEIIRGDLRNPTKELTELTQRIYASLARREVSEEDAQEALQGIHDRRKRQRGAATRRLSVGAPLIKRKPTKADDRPRALKRRYMAKVASIPANLARYFSTAQVAVLGVVGLQVRQFAACQLAVGAIAAKAGVCVRTVQSALREAANYGLLGIRRRRYAPSVITILKDEWKDWLKTSSSTPRKALEMKDILDPPKGAKMCDSEPEESPPAKVVAVAEIVEEPIPDSVPAQAPQEPAEPDVLALAKTAFDRRLDALLAKVEPVRPGPAPVEESYNPNLSEVITLCGSWKNAWGYVEDLSPARYPKVYEKPAYTGHRTGIRQEVRDWLTQRHGGEWSIKSAFAEDGLRRILLGLGHHSHAVEFRMRWSGR